MQFEDLEDFLLSDRAPESTMQLCDLDGFLTGLAVGPEMIMPSEWLPAIWGEDGEPEFADEDEAANVVGTIVKRFQAIGQALETGQEDALDPIFMTAPDGTVIAGDWAEGFMDAVRMRPSAWQPLFDDNNAILYAAPIVALCLNDQGESPFDLEVPGLAKIYSNAPNLIPGAVISIDRFWRQRQANDNSRPSDAMQPIKRQKIGRNELCPCGSGKKYKKCCGA